MHIHQEDIYQRVRRQGIIYQGLADACRSDEDRLREVEERPNDVLRKHGINVPVGVDVKVVLNTRDTFYLAMPPDPNQTLQDEALMVVAGGGKTMGTVGTIATTSTLPSCLGTAGSMSSFATARDSL